VKLGVLVAVVVAIALGGGVLVGHFVWKPAPAAEAEKPDAPDPKPIVRLAKATHGTLDMRLVAFGVAVSHPENERIVTARVAAIVSSVHARKGDRLKEGDLILTLDARPLAALRRKAEGALAEAEAELAKAQRGNLATELAGFKVALAQAKADLLQAERVLVRQRELAKEGLVAARALEEAEAAAEIARLRGEAAELQVEKAEHGVQREETARLDARVAQARADLETAKLQEGYASVRAEIEGTVAELDAVPGQSVDATTALGRLVTPGAVDALLSLAAEQADKVALGSDVRILSGATELGHGTIEGISGAVSADGSRTIRVGLAKDTAAIVPGTPVTGEIATARIESTVVPREAVIQDNDRTVVLVLVQQHDPDPKEPEPIEVAKKIEVKVLVRDGPLVGIEGEVPEGEEVIVEGGYNLPDGTEVERAR
jgi:multidrug efflux pump subunit AcrA (membrane-fusion protein)